jgi:hypothetical protein
MVKALTLEEIVDLTKQLSLRDKVRLIERIAPQIERELAGATSKPRVSLRGLWQGARVTEEEISEARREMWADFPRDDI